MKILVIVAALALVIVPLASGDPPAFGKPTPDVGFNSELPVAGKSFTGLTVANPGSLEWAACSARLKGHNLATRTMYFYSASGEVQTVSCAWRIPKGTAGKRLYVHEGDSTGYSATHIWPVQSS